MLELHINENDVSSGTIPISWCIDKGLLDRFAEQKGFDPTLVLCISPVKNYHPSKEVRKVLPLKDLMTFITFHCSGENRIWGFVSYWCKKDVRRIYLSKENGTFSTDILSPDGDQYAHRFDDEEWRGRFASVVNVLVPDNLFAKEPAPWLKSWVNHCFRDKSFDECGFRRRMLFAFLVQPIILLGLLLAKLPALLIAIAIADKGLLSVLKTIYSPLTYGIEDSYGALRGTALLYHWKTEEEDFRAVWKSKEANIIQLSLLGLKKVWLFPLMPFIPLIGYLLFRSHALFRFLEISGIVISSSFLTLCLIQFVNTVTFNKITSFFDRIFTWISSFFRFDRDPTFWEAEQLLCTGETKPLAISALPANRRSIKLRYLALKSQVCRPFSR